MNEQLALTGQQFELLSGIFFWGYFIFVAQEVPLEMVLFF
jgi:hypothetical protein